MNTSVEVPASEESPDFTQPEVTMLADLTVSPVRVKVKAGYRVMFINDSGRYKQIHSYNCTEFQMVDPQPGTSIRTSPFSPAGKVCDYFAWERNRSRKIFVGQVEVVP
jgi:hypothetical protein